MVDKPNGMMLVPERNIGWFMLPSTFSTMCSFEVDMRAAADFGVNGVVLITNGNETILVAPNIWLKAVGIRVDGHLIPSVVMLSFFHVSLIVGYQLLIILLREGFSAYFRD